eukprot:JP441474.1.p1 GENE.JP441474.1~~JP441474.1.p1  ORF type:complete len:89 (-),score=8.86 JP441474.1:33-299(-)
MGHKLEAWKFSLYVLMPILCVVVCTNESLMTRIQDKMAYVRYPPSKTTEEIEESHKRQSKLLGDLLKEQQEAVKLRKQRKAATSEAAE